MVLWEVRVGMGTATADVDGWNEASGAEREENKDWSLYCKKNIQNGVILLKIVANLNTRCFPH